MSPGQMQMIDSDWFKQISPWVCLLFFCHSLGLHFNHILSVILPKLRVVLVMSYFPSLHPWTHLPWARPSQLRCLLLNMRSADLKFNPHRSNSAKQQRQNQATLLYHLGSVADHGLFGAWNGKAAVNAIDAFSGQRRLGIQEHNNCLWSCCICVRCSSCIDDIL